jgi:hypothetical protein
MGKQGSEANRHVDYVHEEDYKQLNVWLGYQALLENSAQTLASHAGGRVQWPQ